MYNCLLTVIQDSHNDSKKVQNDHHTSKTLKGPQPCLLSMDNYCLTFVSTENNEKIIYQTTVKGLIPSVNSKEKLLTLTNRESKFELLQIKSELDILDKIKYFCQRPFDESLLWNPIVFFNL